MSSPRENAPLRNATLFSSESISFLLGFSSALALAMAAVYKPLIFSRMAVLVWASTASPRLLSAVRYSMVPRRAVCGRSAVMALGGDRGVGGLGHEIVREQVDLMQRQFIDADVSEEFLHLRGILAALFGLGFHPPLVDGSDLFLNLLIGGRRGEGQSRERQRETTGDQQTATKGKANGKHHPAPCGEWVLAAHWQGGRSAGGHAVGKQALRT